MIERKQLVEGVPHDRPRLPDPRIWGSRGLGFLMGRVSSECESDAHRFLQLPVLLAICGTDIISVLLLHPLHICLWLVSHAIPIYKSIFIALHLLGKIEVNFNIVCK